MISQIHFIIILFGFLSFSYCELSAQFFPGTSWEIFDNPQDIGFSNDGLSKVKSQFRQNGGDAIMVVYKGKIILAEGEVERKFMVHSIRKSFLSALYGIYEAKGVIDLDKTLKDLQIDDLQNLSIKEKQATIYDLLSARSGVYHPSAYSPDGMEKNLPERESKKSGSFWYYNNWDFNTLGAIFNQLTESDLFEEFHMKIASPIGMEDFEVSDCYYRFEPNKSRYPAYLIRMSARDMARFGVLYLNRGHWNGKSIIPEAWVVKSTKPITVDLGPRFNHKGSFGLLWWIADRFSEPVYYASGAGGHRIFILPESDLVIVHRMNTYEGHSVSDKACDELIQMVLDSKTGTAKMNPMSKPFVIDRTEPQVVSLEKEELKQFVGTYKHAFLGDMKISSEEDKLKLETNVGIFSMKPIGNNSFFPEDIRSTVFFEMTESQEKAYTIEVKMKDDRNIDSIIFYYKGR